MSFLLGSRLISWVFCYVIMGWAAPIGISSWWGGGVGVGEELVGLVWIWSWRGVGGEMERRFVNRE
jgi:hypothetical protein